MFSGNSALDGLLLEVLVVLLLGGAGGVGTELGEHLVAITCLLHKLIPQSGQVQHWTTCRLFVIIGHLVLRVPFEVTHLVTKDTNSILIYTM